MLFDWTRQDKMRKVLRKSSFSTPRTTKINNQFTYLLPVGCLDASGREKAQDSLCVVRSFEKEDFFENLSILTSCVQSKSVLFNLLYVFDLMHLKVLFFVVVFFNVDSRCINLWRCHVQLVA